MKRMVVCLSLSMIFSMVFLTADIYAQFPGGGGFGGGGFGGGMPGGEGGEKPEINKEKMEEMRKEMKEKVEKELEDVVNQMLDEDTRVQMILREKIREKEERMQEEGSDLGTEFGFFYPSFSGINDHIEELGIKKSDSTVPRLEGGFLPGITWRYSFTPEFQAGYYGAMADYWCRGETASVAKEVGVNFNFNGGLAVFRPRISGQIRLYLGVAVGTVSAVYREDSGNSSSYKWSGLGIGCMPLMGLQWKLNSLLGFSADFGYMIAAIPSAAMSPREGTPSGVACPDIDMSGSLIKLGIQYHF